MTKVVGFHPYFGFIFMTLFINHMEDKEILDTMNEEELKRVMDYYHEDY